MKGTRCPMESKAKPTLNISANVDSYGVGSDDSWKKKEAKRIKSEIALINKALKKWDDAKAGKQAELVWKLI